VELDKNSGKREHHRHRARKPRESTKPKSKNEIFLAQAAKPVLEVLALQLVVEMAVVPL
jgi:hypothetical protein